MKESADPSDPSPDPFAEQFESEEPVQDRWVNHPTRTCFEAKPTPELLRRLFGDLPPPPVSGTVEAAKPKPRKRTGRRRDL